MGLFFIGFERTKPYVKDWLRRYMQMDPIRKQEDIVSEKELQGFYENVMKAKMVIIFVCY